MSGARRRGSPGAPDTGASVEPVLIRKPSPTRVKAQALGIRAEQAAAAYISGRGYSILASNLRVGRCEIDLLAREDDVIVVIEVRARGPGALVRALDSIDGRKRRRLRIAGERLWRERFARDRAVQRLRFDCLAVAFDESGTAQVEHVRAAF